MTNNDSNATKQKLYEGLGFNECQARALTGQAPAEYSVTEAVEPKAGVIVPRPKIMSDYPDKS